MDKKSGGRRADGKPKFRKEDISKPVDFRHIDGYTKNQQGQTIRKGSMSACTSPTFNGPEFFKSTSVPNGNDNNSNRLSDPSGTHTEFLHGKENAAFERYQQFTDEEQFNMYDSSRSSFGGENSEVLRRSKNSGSLSSFPFLQFAKQVNPRDNSPKSKRVSLGSLLPGSKSSFTPSESFYPPPPSPIYETITDERGVLTRRRSSSFSGDAEMLTLKQKIKNAINNDGTVTTAPVRDNVDNPRSSIFNWKKKPKFSGPVPPVSPTYDQLPPPPPPAFADEIYDVPRMSSAMPLPECPSYSDLPPPPPPTTDIQEEVETTLVYRRGFKGHPLTISQDEELPPPPQSSPNPQPGDQETSNDTGTIKRRPKLPPANPRPLQVPTASSSGGSSTLQKKLPEWRSRAVKVSAPTIPPSSAPFVKNPSKEGSPSTPDSWPLAPSFPTVQNGHDNYEEIGQYSLPPPPQPEYTHETTDFASLPNMPLPSSSTQPQSMNSSKVDREHLKPLSRLLQQRVPVNLWPVVMTQLFSSSAISDESEAKQSYNESAAYSELITKTLELLLEMTNGDVSFDEVISAYDKIQ